MSQTLATPPQTSPREQSEVDAYLVGCFTHRSGHEDEFVQIHIRHGSPALGSVYKLVFAGWVVSWGVLAVTILSLSLLTSLLIGSTSLNGEEVQGRGAVLVTLLPIFVFFLFVIFFQALMFSGFLTLGVWLYRKVRPITVVNQDAATSF